MPVTQSEYERTLAQIAARLQTPGLYTATPGSDGSPGYLMAMPTQTESGEATTYSQWVPGAIPGTLPVRPDFDPVAMGLDPMAGSLGEQTGWYKYLGDRRQQQYDMQGNPTRIFENPGLGAQTGALATQLAPLALAALTMGTLSGAGPLAGMFGEAGAAAGGLGDAGAGLGWMGGADGVGLGTMGDALATGMGTPLTGASTLLPSLTGYTSAGLETVPGFGGGITGGGMTSGLTGLEAASAGLGAAALPGAAAPLGASLPGAGTIGATFGAPTALTFPGFIPPVEPGITAPPATVPPATTPSTAPPSATPPVVPPSTSGLTGNPLLDKALNGAALAGGAGIISNVLTPDAPDGTGGAITDPLALIAAQGKENRDTFQYMLDNSRIGSTNSYGGSQWAKDASGRWQFTQSLNPASQGIFDTATEGLGNAVKALPTNGMDAYNKAVADAIYKRSRLYLDPADAQARSSMQSNLADRGFQVGNEGYNTEMTRLDDSQSRGRADAAYQATIQGAGEGRANIATQQGIINALSGVRRAQTDGLAGNPSTSSIPNLQPTDITGINQNAANNALDAQNAAAYGRNQMFGNLLNFGASVFGAGGKGGW